ncbi:hypothetical protein SCHPADRAFT_812964, partial [Schizopora paradoxa]
IVLGKYTDSHSHPTGNKNLKFTRLSEATKRNIADMLEMRIELSHILKLVQGGFFHEGAEAPPDIDGVQIRRDTMVTMNDIIRVKRELDAQAIRLHKDDGLSVE